MKKDYIIFYFILGIAILSILSNFVITTSATTTEIDCPNDGEIVGDICYVKNTREANIKYS
jgi:hypothetical protein